MQPSEVFGIEMLAKNIKDVRYEQLESGIVHTPYEVECALFSCIENGDLQALKEKMRLFMTQNVVVGRMSNNDLRQMQYFAVCCITMATRYAIRGGLRETVAYQFSDACIQHIDSMQQVSSIPAFLFEKAVELTQLVHASETCRDCPQSVRRAVYYIDTHLYQKISLSDVAQFCGLSKDHLNTVFRSCVGKTMGDYIRQAKLKEGKRLLQKGFSVADAAYQLGFCSESYFVACYKKHFGYTPRHSIKTK